MRHGPIRTFGGETAWDRVGDRGGTDRDETQPKTYVSNLDNASHHISNEQYVFEEVRI